MSPPHSWETQYGSSIVRCRPPTSMATRDTAGLKCPPLSPQKQKLVTRAGPRLCPGKVSQHPSRLALQHQRQPRAVQDDSHHAVLMPPQQMLVGARDTGWGGQSQPARRPDPRMALRKDRPSSPYRQPPGWSETNTAPGWGWGGFLALPGEKSGPDWSTAQPMKTLFCFLSDFFIEASWTSVISVSGGPHKDAVLYTLCLGPPVSLAHIVTTHTYRTVLLVMRILRSTLSNLQVGGTVPVTLVSQPPVQTGAEEEPTGPCTTQGLRPLRFPGGHVQNRSFCDLLPQGTPGWSQPPA